MHIRPLGDRALIKPLEAEEVTKSGIIIPDTVDKEKKAEGKIVALGDGEKLKKLALKVGDKVLFGSYRGEDIKVDEVEYKILNHDDILAVIAK
ncbi:MAG: co-chaperone GroES [Parcubacteria group bacterium CG08_land_8_20_14_0_20_48_21]|nr:MAG: co-chaperone GroES [Parcubacteria group bacterium CG2_30_48_51]PIS33196.1 MAG: co-chaperone GroES [Parcubacteria group bacterium CG08_land_8_20_14_0_20_48_21]PIW79439.1 MAG: co-chaperone GroES [Parcubacteria group bacterium CG_4_8_14_3_um_filter_48_16]PIY77700.1 MAG: co-chaperone GroES [Parcubacteria group bacterium CG_4_10_14_0_8_um_filter_48_154]PIZ77476.1 MAG: co-chaperone GroES [bacterium CG_4_10_14_0_2_um_filter_48_144]PJC40011.1 MAG: co-chaperone GroES [Parcubacteria group bacter